MVLSIQILIADSHWHLSLKAKLSRAYATYLIFTLLYIIYILQSTTYNIKNSADDVKKSLVTTCAKAQTSALNIASTPDLMLKLVRTSVLEAANNAVHQLGNLFALGTALLPQIHHRNRIAKFYRRLDHS
jgi:hypothetical protein